MFSFSIQKVKSTDEVSRSHYLLRISNCAGFSEGVQKI